MEHNLLCVLGATATGKTTLAVHLAHQLGGEIISADSRQIYRGMDLGTGKDLEEYSLGDVNIPYHLIDIVDAGYKYNVFEYQRDFLKVYHSIRKRGNLPVLCGGTGMYLEAVLKGYRLIAVPNNEALRAKLQDKSLAELVDILKTYKTLHNNSDIDTHKRAIRAIEIEEYYTTHPQIEQDYPQLNPLLVGIKFDRESRRSRITQRLKSRLQEGMIQEVEQLISNGVAPEDLIYYGLEYKYLTQYVTGELSYEQMFSGLEVSIHQFAKRQMTWFRKMERSGANIHWLDGYMPLDEKIERVKGWMKD